MAQFHTKPDGPEQVGVFAVSSSSIAVYWSRVQGATAYKVYRASNLGQYNWGSPVAVINTNLNQPILKWVDTGLPSYSMRYYRVTAVVDGYQSQPSDEDCHYANPNALPWDQTPQDVVDELDNLSFPYLFPINGNAALAMPMGEYQDSVEPTLTGNPAGRVDEDREMITSGGMVSPFLGDGLQAKTNGDPIHPSDLPLFPSGSKVQAEGAYTRRDAPHDDFIGFAGTFIFPSFDNPLYFLCHGVTPDGGKPANSLNMYVGWAPPIPVGPEPSKRTITADIGLQYYPASDNSGTPRQVNPGNPGEGLPPRYNPFIRVSNGKEVIFTSPQLNNSTVYPSKRYLEAYSPTGWLFATIRVAYLADSKLILFQTVWGTCNSNGTGKYPTSAPFPVLAAPSSGPFYEPENNMGGQDLENQKPFSFDDRMTSRRVVSVAQNDHAGDARALKIYEGASISPANPGTSPWLWRLPFAAYVDSSYAREVKMQGWECMGYSGTWLENPFDTDELDTGNYLRFARHDTGSTPLGCIYHGFHPLLDSIISIDHTVSP